MATSSKLLLYPEHWMITRNFPVAFLRLRRLPTAGFWRELALLLSTWEIKLQTHFVMTQRPPGHLPSGSTAAGGTVTRAFSALVWL